METILYILTFLLAVFGGSYILLLILFTIGWFCLKQNDLTDFTGKVSVIIPVRNEAQCIGLLLSDLEQQNISHEDFEVLVIDDHSEDLTVKVISDFGEQHSKLNLRLFTNSNEGKKEAITLGVLQAKAEIILCTDADCRVNQYWIQSVKKIFGKPHIQMVSAPVCFFKGNSIFQKIQSLEFLSLIGSAAGAIGIKFPFMCNGANLAFRKEAFLKVEGFKDNINLSSGDDVFLLHKIKKHFGSLAIGFIKDKKAIVQTVSPNNFTFFIKQRKRWASKSKKYKDLFAILVAFTVFGFNIILVTLVFFSVFSKKALLIFLMGLGIKIIIDFTLLMDICFFVQRRKLMWYYIPIQIIYPIYISIVSVLVFFAKNDWKGRKIKG